MTYTFKSLVDTVLRHLDEVTNVGTTRELVKETMNLMHQQRINSFPWLFMLWPRPCILEVTPGQREYSLHQEYSQPFYFYNRTKHHYMVELPTRAMGQNPGDIRALESEDRLFALWGTMPVKEQPILPSALTIQSSSASDSGSTREIAIKGEIEDGSLIAEVITPSGMTPVASTNVFKTISAVTKEHEWSGTLTLSAGSQTLLTLNRYEMGRTYRVITLLKTPTEPQTIEYRFYRQPLALINDYDVPEIPSPHTPILVWDTLLAMAAYQTDARPTQIALWKEFQIRAETAMNQALMAEQQTVAAMPTFIHDSFGGDLSIFPVSS